MAYDDNLASRVNAILAGLSGLLEKRMFGGIGYLLNGNMACGVHKKCLIVRVGPDRYQAALEQDHTKVFDITGRPMTGWVMVSSEGVATNRISSNGYSKVSSLPAHYHQSETNPQ